MANTYAETILLEARAKLAQRSEKKFEQRRDLSNIYNVFKSGQDWIPNLEAIKEATTQATKIEYLDKITFTDGTTKTCSPSGDVGGSQIVDVSWAQKVRTIKVNEKQHDGNDYKMAEALANLIEQMEMDIWNGAAGMEVLMLAFLEANRTQVNAIDGSNSENTWFGTPNFYAQTANANLDRFYNYLLSDMQLNNYNAPIWDIHDTLWNAEVANYASQGTANSVNTAFQFDGFDRVMSNFVAPAGYFKSTHYVIPDGGVSSLYWNEPINRRGATGADGKIWTVQQSMMRPDVTYDLFIDTACADTTSDGGSKQDLVHTYEFTINYAFVNQPITNTGETAIFKYNVANA